ncbi:MAG: hypothetical protein WC562_08700 [Dehalococcoidia bacterium]
MTVKYGNYVGWTAFLDVFGFKGLEIEKGLPQLNEILNHSHSEAQKHLTERETIPRVYLRLQDSLLLLYPCNPQDEDSRVDVMQQCIGEIREVMAIFSDCEVPLRGGIAYGKVIYNENSITGKPQERALLYESVAPAPLVLMGARECMPDPEKQTHDCVKEYLSPAFPRFQEIKLKKKNTVRDGCMMGALFYPSPRDNFLRMVHDKYLYHGTWGPPEVAVAWSEAYHFIERDLSREDIKE